MKNVFSHRSTYSTISTFFHYTWSPSAGDVLKLHQHMKRGLYWETFLKDTVSALRHNAFLENHIIKRLIVKQIIFSIRAGL